MCVCVRVFGVMDWQFHVPGSCLVSAHQTRLEEIHRMVAPPTPTSHSLSLLSYKASCCKQRSRYRHMPRKYVTYPQVFFKQLSLSNVEQNMFPAGVTATPAHCTQGFCVMNTATERCMFERAPRHHFTCFHTSRDLVGERGGTH